MLLAEWDGMIEQTGWDKGGMEVLFVVNDGEELRH